MLYECRPQVYRLVACDRRLSLMSLYPIAIDIPGAIIRIGAVDGQSESGVTIGVQQVPQIRLGAPRLGEDDSFSGAANLSEFLKAQFERPKERLSFRIDRDGGCQITERI